MCLLLLFIQDEGGGLDPVPDDEAGGRRGLSPPPLPSGEGQADRDPQPRVGLLRPRNRHGAEPDVSGPHLHTARPPKM